MMDNVTHTGRPPRGAAWVLVALAGAALGLLRTTVGTMGHDDSTAGAALSGFIIVGARAILLYFFLRLIKRPGSGALLPPSDSGQPRGAVRREHSPSLRSGCPGGQSVQMRRNPR